MFKSEEEEMENRSWNDDILLVVGSKEGYRKGLKTALRAAIV